MDDDNTAEVASGARAERLTADVADGSARTAEAPKARAAKPVTATAEASGTDVA